MKNASYWAAVAAVCTILVYPSIVAASTVGLSVLVAAGISKASRIVGGRPAARHRLVA